jgi:putative oxidoreductase
MKALLRTDDSLPLLIARLALGLVMLPHGLQKTIGLFGGYGFSGTMLVGGGGRASLDRAIVEASR